MRTTHFWGDPVAALTIRSGNIMALHHAFSSLLPRCFGCTVGAGLSLILGVSSAGYGQEPAEAPPAAVAPAQAPPLSLEDCLRIGRENQPSLKAAYASLVAAQYGQQGLNDIRFGSRFSRELPIRKQQSAFGVSAAAANLAQVQRDVDCSVARTYFSVLYARDQRKVAEQIVLRLKAAVANGETLLGKEGAPPDLNPLSITKAKALLSQVESRVAETTSGLQRATAGLREAMGVSQDFPINVAEGNLPEPLLGVNKRQIIDLAVSLRGEVGQAQSAVCITRLEVQAQEATWRVKRPTSAAGGDMHARPIPTGSFGDDYKPGAIGLDFPTLFVGPREDRVQRACQTSMRAEAALEKARNLVALEAEDAFLKWEEAITKIEKYKKSSSETEVAAKRAISALESGVIQSYRDVLEILALGAQTQAFLNEATYKHAVALTELERVTAGGFAAGAAIPRPSPQP
jgi:outer membrane protein TolC